jgi:3-hydroxyacyl-CoA dehydrogenase
MSEHEVMAIIGSGTRGPGMAATMARVGSRVILHDISEDALGRAKDGAALAGKVLETLDAPSAPGGSIAYTTDRAEAVREATLVMEAVPERLEIKREVFAELDRLAPADAVLASNTSGIPISQIASACERPERVIGMHWSNPPHLIPMIEVIPHPGTDQAVTDRLTAAVQSIGYEAVLIRKEVPGFVENRILYAILREALSLYEEGVIGDADLDTCVRWGIGYKLAVIGPLELLDMAGLDIYHSVASYLNADLSNESGVSSTITDRTTAGTLGMKTGRGIYEYTPEDIASKRAERARKLVAVRKALES